MPTLQNPRHERFAQELATGIGRTRKTVPNHLFTLLSMVTMEPPVGFDATAIRSKKAELWGSVECPIVTLWSPLVRSRPLRCQPWPLGLEPNPRPSLSHCTRSWIMMATTPTVTATADMPTRMADASKSIIDDGANHRTISAGRTRSVTSSSRNPRFQTTPNKTRRRTPTCRFTHAITAARPRKTRRRVLARCGRGR